MVETKQPKEKTTSIKVKEKTKELLDTFKVSDRQTYDEIINLLATHCQEAIKQGDLELYKW